MTLRESISELLYRDYLENKGADAQAVMEKLNAVSQQLKAAGIPDYPDDIMVAVVRACEEHEHAGFLAGLQYGAQLHELTNKSKGE